MTFLTLLAASILGGFISQLTSFWILGALVHRRQKMNNELMLKTLEEHHELLRKEQERMKEYARMEG